MELMQASRQWSARPADERFVSLDDMQQHFDVIRSESRERVMPSRRITALPHDGDTTGKAMVVDLGDGKPYAPTNYAFGQLCQLAAAPAGYLSTLPAPMAADCVNFGLNFKRDIADVGLLVQNNHTDYLRAATGPNYGRIWNADIVESLRSRFGDGRDVNTFKVPGEFGRDVTVNKGNTTLYAGDRDMFVFLADERNRVELPNRRNGQSGSMARGFFIWNSEVGDKTFGFGTFLFDYVCMNRIVWGAEHYSEVRIRHTKSAPDKFLSEMQPAIEALSNASTHNITAAIEAARAARIQDDLTDFLGKRFGKRMAAPLMAIHEAEEGRPIETLWDATTAATAYARSIEHADKRVELEREAGKLLKLAA